MIDEKEEWVYWNSLGAFRLYEGVYLQQGILPPRDIDSLSYEERHEWRHDIFTMVDSEKEFAQILSSLRSDEIVGKEFRAIDENKKAAFHFVTRSIFIDHWKKQKFRFHRKFQIGQQGRGGPKKVHPEALINFAKECAVRKKEYADFIRAAEKEFDCSGSRVKQLLPAKTYKKL